MLSLKVSPDHIIQQRPAQAGPLHTVQCGSITATSPASPACRACALPLGLSVLPVRHFSHPQLTSHAPRCALLFPRKSDTKQSKQNLLPQRVLTGKPFPQTSLSSTLASTPTSLGNERAPNTPLWHCSRPEDMSAAVPLALQPTGRHVSCSTTGTARLMKRQAAFRKIDGTKPASC